VTGQSPKLLLSQASRIGSCFNRRFLVVQGGKGMCLRRCLHFVLFSALAVYMAGCGSVSNNSSTSPTPTPGPGTSPTPSPSPTPTPVNGQVELQANGEALVAGVQAELRSTFEQIPGRTRLDGELEHINLPVGSAISFCLTQGGNTIPLAVGIIQLEGQDRVAELHIRTDNGQTPPNVQVGNVLQARDGANGSLADCSRPLLVTATFVPGNSSGQ
jgi:hypothetical protein